MTESEGGRYLEIYLADHDVRVFVETRLNSS